MNSENFTLTSQPYVHDSYWRQILKSLVLQSSENKVFIHHYNIDFQPQIALAFRSCHKYIRKSHILSIAYWDLGTSLHPCQYGVGEVSLDFLVLQVPSRCQTGY